MRTWNISWYWLNNSAILIYLLNSSKQFAKLCLPVNTLQHLFLRALTHPHWPQQVLELGAWLWCSANLCKMSSSCVTAVLLEAEWQQLSGLQGITCVCLCKSLVTVQASFQWHFANKWRVSVTSLDRQQWHHWHQWEAMNCCYVQVCWFVKQVAIGGLIAWRVLSLQFSISKCVCRGRRWAVPDTACPIREGNRRAQ